MITRISFESGRPQTESVFCPLPVVELWVKTFHLWASVSSFVREGKSVISTTRGHWSDELMLVDYCWAHRKRLITCYLWFRHRWSSRYGWEIGLNPSRLFFPWSQMQSFFSRPFKSLVTLHCIFLDASLLDNCLRAETLCLLNTAPGMEELGGRRKERREGGRKERRKEMEKPAICYFSRLGSLIPLSLWWPSNHKTGL